MKLAILISPSDVKYLPWVKTALTGHKTDIYQECPDTAWELTAKYDGIICAQQSFLQKLVTDKLPGINLDNYAGSLFHRGGKPIVIVDPLEQIVTTKIGDFLFKRYLSKLLKPEQWQSELPFEWAEIQYPSEFEAMYLLASSTAAIAMAIDIETAPEPLRIQICSYCIVYRGTNDSINLATFTFWINSQQRLDWMRKLNATEVPKIFQNGIYDNSWFIYYNACPKNWTMDTMDLLHSWYSELPKKLDFVASFCIRDTVYWKNGAKTNLTKYGCMDVWATACSWLFLMEHLPTWAWRNYVDKFPLNYPALLCGIRGWKIDTVARDSILDEQVPEVEDNRKLLRTVVGNQHFNPGSPKQVQAFLQIISCSKDKITSADKKSVEKIASQHAINEYLCEALQNYSEAQKLVSSYLKAKLLNGRFLYTLAPSGIDTSRFASHGSVFWTGNSIQVIPRGSVIKSMYVADDGFYLAEPDAEQADARGVAYLSGDENLIATVEDVRDYHRVNAEKFFGVVYDQITTLLRDLSKRVNHGTNFNMGARTLLKTMGIANVVKARELLHLDPNMKLVDVCEHLLLAYHTSYPDIRAYYYPWLVAQVMGSRKITGPTGLTRYFFGNPDKNKQHLNQIIAHSAQSLTGQIINQGFDRLYKFEKRTNGDFKLMAQIHDSIPFQYRIGRLDLAIEAARLMEIPTKVTDCRGKERVLVIPIALKAEAHRWSELKKVSIK